MATKGPRPRVVVCGDDFRLALHGHSFIPQAEGTVFAAMDVAILALLIGGNDVIVDETSTTEATVLRYLKIDIYAVPIIVGTEMDVCIERAIKTGKPYLSGPIVRMAAQMQKLMSDWPGRLEQLRTQQIMRLGQDVTV